MGEVKNVTANESPLFESDYSFQNTIFDLFGTAVIQNKKFKGNSKTKFSNSKVTPPKILRPVEEARCNGLQDDNPGKNKNQFSRYKN